MNKNIIGKTRAIVPDIKRLDSNYLKQVVKRLIRSLLGPSLFETLWSVRKFVVKKVPNVNIYMDHIADKSGIEIGGPSTVFDLQLPIYKKIRSLDGVNFSSSTMWEGQLKSGNTYSFSKNKKGFQFLCDGTELNNIKDSSYDFCVSSNCLEHIANPLKALTEWKRILKDSGCLILVLPNKKHNFDHNRPITKFEHLLRDYNHNTSERDLACLDEVLELHDLSLDLPAGNFENFKARCMDNYNNRGLHHHVFDLGLMVEMVEFLDFKCVQKCEWGRDFFMLAVK
tara:strand:- start:25 stop:873 length:849 start_codon:yes stop_codon:yes gene_type:complete